MRRDQLEQPLRLGDLRTLPLPEHSGPVTDSRDGQFDVDAVVRRPVIPDDLTRSERRSWRLHRQLSTHLTKDSLEEWCPIIERNLQRLRSSVAGQPHSRNLDRWDSLVERGDLPGLHRVLTGLDRDSIEMREVSPMSGLLPQSKRQAVLQEAN